MQVSRASWRHLRSAVLVLVVVACSVAVFEQRDALGDALRTVGFGRIGVAMVCVLAAMYSTSLAWRRVMSALGAPLPGVPASQIFFASQLGKYLPGSVWGVALQMSLAREHGASRRQTATAFVIVTMLSLCSAGVVGVTGLALGRGLGSDVDLRIAIAVSVAGALALHPAILRRLIHLGHRILRQPTDGITLDSGALVTAMGWQLVSWLFFGLHMTVLATAFDVTSGRMFFLSTGAFALAWSIGFLVVLVPAGLGVREVALTTLLAVVLTADEASGLALVSRGLTVTGEAVLGVAAIASLGFGRVRARVRAEAMASEPTAPERDRAARDVALDEEIRR